MTSEVISYEEIRKIQALERDNRALQELTPDFFLKIKEYISNKEKIINENKDKNNVFSSQAIEKNEYELRNVKRIIEDICSRRRRKIVMQALNNLSARVHNTENMLPEEEDMYNSIINTVNEYTNRFMSKFEAPPSIDIKREEKEEEKGLKKLKFIEDIPAFLWKDGETYGPFNKDDDGSLPLDVGEILIKEGKAIEIKESDDNEDTKGNQ